MRLNRFEWQRTETVEQEKRTDSIGQGGETRTHGLYVLRVI